jgi:hypothetical protein
LFGEYEALLPDVGHPGSRASALLQGGEVLHGNAHVDFLRGLLIDRLQLCRVHLAGNLHGLALGLELLNLRVQLRLRVLPGMHFGGRGSGKLLGLADVHDLLVVRPSVRLQCLHRMFDARCGDGELSRDALRHDVLVMSRVDVVLRHVLLPGLHVGDELLGHAIHLLGRRHELRLILLRGAGRLHLDSERFGCRRHLHGHAHGCL